MVFLDLMYKVGSFDDPPQQRGIAHFYEHMMFSGSTHIPDYPKATQDMGGKSNAYTAFDRTVYMMSLPKENLEAAFWLESDRLLFPQMKSDKLEVQRKVILEEFKQIRHSRPYGDIFDHLLDLSYVDPCYTYSVIGKELSDIENITLEDINAFGQNFYTPTNAVLVISGDISPAEVEPMVEKWFGEGKPSTVQRTRPPLRDETKRKGVEKSVDADVPANSLTYAYHIPSQLDKAHLPLALITTLLGQGASSNLHRVLVDEKGWAGNVMSACIDTFYGGLLLIQARLQEGVSYEEVEQVIQQEITTLQKEGIREEALEKIKNRQENQFDLYKNNLHGLNSMLASGHYLGDPLFSEKMFKEKLPTITSKEVQAAASDFLASKDVIKLYYNSRRKGTDKKE